MSKLGTIKYRLYQDNREKSINKGKWYARAVHERNVEFEDFVEHMAEHNSTFSRGTINGVLIDMLDCLKELVLDGKTVRLGDIGMFSVGINTLPSETAQDFNVGKNVKGVHLNVRNTKMWSNRELRNRCKISELPMNTVDSSKEADEDVNP